MDMHRQGAPALDSGDTAFVIISSILVLLMTLPGLMLFYGGLTGFKSVLSTALQTLAIASMISIVWLMFGYSLAFGVDFDGGNNRFIGGANKFWFRGDGKDTTRLLMDSQIGTIPESVFIMFQMTFAIITAAIVAGSLAERMKFSSMLIFFFLWHCTVYCPVAHWVWGQGFLQKWGAIDFAGGTVVHIVAGITGMVGSVILGPRRPHVEDRSEHTVLMTFIGGCFLWVGWFGFNAGSALTAGTRAGMAMLITHLAAATCSFTWMLIEWLHTRTPTIIGAVSGAITGLVIITPAAGYVDHTGAFVMGLVGAPLCYGGIMFKNWIGLDEKPRQSDYPDAFGVHSVGGIVGAILTGFFAQPAIGGEGGAFYPLDGDKYTDGKQLGHQFAAVGITIAYTALVSALWLLILKVTIGINNPEEPDPEPEPEPEPEKTIFVQPVVHTPMVSTPVQYGFQGPMGMAPLGAAIGQPYGMMGGFA